ncbi:recombinase family protein [Gluconacetobacter diazotrophicus]|uniref:Putative DNA recombinase n=1 Tax=Gluconacetobacter diazotrophicus (strain ATCC 49037 / DSM 5601 / CCUG 37298 / CIP 103539 / LMG 7603 / PAl5) TaxID=272568 RepID=A9HSX1_GLUDA|nr:recombinase family protein [Gluconacetobacter diazotrophicus]CAP57839.1 putative DNA recombinase [Gluconacetobacter diazotrophicus PA1 5]
MKIGYARVSRADKQDLSMQIQALEKEGCDTIYQDTASAKNTARPQLQEMLRYARQGDEIVVWRLDRLSRSLTDLISLTDDLGARGIGLRSLTEPVYQTSGPMGRVVLQIMAVLAEFERATIIERTKAGLRAAKERGVHVGRPKLLSEDQAAHVVQEIEAGRLTLSEAANLFGVSRSTISRIRRDMKATAPQIPVS